SAARLRNGDGRAHVTPFGLGSASRPWQRGRTVTRLSREVNRRGTPASINRSEGTPARAPNRWLLATLNGPAEDSGRLGQVWRRRRVRTPLRAEALCAQRTETLH